MRVSKNSVIFNRVNSGAELLFHSKVVAKVDKFKGEVVLKLGSFKTPTAINHVQGFLDKKWTPFPKRSLFQFLRQLSEPLPGLLARDFCLLEWSHVRKAGRRR